jgi:hypothetical protein
MPLFLDTRGKSTLGIGVCARCGCKMSLDDLMADGNSPGLRVCAADRDTLDPWRLPPKKADRITLTHPRPDLPLWPFSPIPVNANQINGITQEFPTVTWTHVTPYVAGATVTPLNPNDLTVDLPQYQFLALNKGVSGIQPPIWPTRAGVEVVDGGVTWLCLGIFLLDGIQPAYVPPAEVLPGNTGIISTPTFLESDGGVLILTKPVWPLGTTIPGGFYSDGGVCAVNPPWTYNPAATPVFFGQITAGALFDLTGDWLPDYDPVNLNQLYLQSLQACISTG